MEPDVSKVTAQPILSPVSLEHKEFPINTNEKDSGNVATEPVTTPTFGIKNSNPLIEDAINDFNFLRFQSTPKNNDNKITFGETLTITFDEEEEVNKLIRKEWKLRNCLRNYGSQKKILKSGPVFIRSTSECDDEQENEADESRSGVEEEDIITLLRRIFTLHGIPLCELGDNLLESLQRLSTGVVESFRQRERCYKYVGRQQYVREINKLEYENENLRDEIANLNKKITDERIKWEVVDEAFAENDSLKTRVIQLTKELEVAPNDGHINELMEADIKMKSEIKDLKTANDILQKQCTEIISLKEKAETQLRETNEQANELRKGWTELNGKLQSCINNNAHQLGRHDEYIQELSSAVEEYRSTNRNNELIKVDLAPKLQIMEKILNDVITENFKLSKKMKLMRKKIYDRFSDDNITLTSGIEGLQEKLGRATAKLEEFEGLMLKNKGLTINSSELDLINKDLSQRLEEEIEKNKQLEMDLNRIRKRLRSAEHWYETLAEEKRQAEAQICQLTKLCQEMNPKVIFLEHELESARRNSLESSEKIEQLQQRIEHDKRSAQDFEKYPQKSNVSQKENIILLEKCSKLELTNSELQAENLGLSSYKKDYSSFTEKYEKLENIAFSLKQEKKFSDNQIKSLEKKLKYAKKTINSKFDNAPCDSGFQSKLNELKLQNFELSQLLCDKDKELRESFDKIEEMATMLRSTMSPATSFFTISDEITLTEHNSDRNTNVFPVKWWKSRGGNNKVNNFIPQSVA